MEIGVDASIKKSVNLFNGLPKEEGKEKIIRSTVTVSPHLIYQSNGKKENLLPKNSIKAKEIQFTHENESHYSLCDLGLKKEIMETARISRNEENHKRERKLNNIVWVFLLFFSFS